MDAAGHRLNDDRSADRSDGAVYTLADDRFSRAPSGGKGGAQPDRRLGNSRSVGHGVHGRTSWPPFLHSPLTWDLILPYQAYCLRITILNDNLSLITSQRQTTVGVRPHRGSSWRSTESGSLALSRSPQTGQIKYYPPQSPLCQGLTPGASVVFSILSAYFIGEIAGFPGY